MSAPLAGSILTLNAGSSSLKFALFDVRKLEAGASAHGEIENLDAAPHLLAADAAGTVLAEQRWPAGLPHPFDTVLETLLGFAESHLGRGGLAAVGHRIVHGGADHIAPAAVTDTLLADLERLTTLDPLHMPHNLAPIRGRDGRRAPRCRRSSASTPRSTIRCRLWHAGSRSRMTCWRPVCGDTGFTDFPSNMSPAA